jgi:hypothetical protein
MKIRMDRVHKGSSENAVHVWGPDFERCALAAEVAGTPVVRLESGGFFAEHAGAIVTLLESQKFEIQHELLTWEIVKWRETGRALFRDAVIDLEEEEHSLDPAWGTSDMSDQHGSALERLVRDTSRRLKMVLSDDVLVMCCWRVLDRERGLLTAQYGLGHEDSHFVQPIIEAVDVSGDAKTRIEQLRIASLAWW